MRFVTANGLHHLRTNIQRRAVGRRRLYCSDACRQRAFRQREEERLCAVAIPNRRRSSTWLRFSTRPSTRRPGGDAQNYRRQPTGCPRKRGNSSQAADRAAVRLWHAMFRPTGRGMTTPLAWSICAVAIGVSGAALWLHVLNAGVDTRGVTDGWATRVLVAPLPAVLAALIASRRPRNPVGWLLLGGVISESVAGLLAEYALYGRTTAPGSLAGTAAAIWLSTFIWTPAIAAFVLMVLLFPDGRLPSPAPAWRLVASAAVGASAALLVSTALAPYPKASAWPPGFVGLNPPLSGVGSALSDPIGALGGLLLLASATGAVWAIVFRFRRSRGVEREQVTWILYAAWIPLALLAAHLLPVQLPSIVGPVAVSAFSVAIAIAILRHRLFDIQVAVSRTFVLVVLIAGLAALYAGVVQETSNVLRGRLGAAPPLLATAVVAMAFAPLHQLVQRAANRFLFGDRGNAGAVMERVGRSIQDPEIVGDVLPALSRTLVAALKLQGARIEPTSDPPATSPSELDSLAIPLVVQGVHVGRVVVIPRRGERLRSADRQLLSALSPHLAIIVRAVQLAEDLQRSRQLLVTTREDERRRIRRDLHDGLGPTLASVAMQVEAALASVTDDPARAAAQLAMTHSHVESAIADIRRLVEGLRPPALDELGLLTAIRHQVSALSERSTKACPTLDIVVEASGELSGLPAAVEVAAYRIAAEAVTNVVRHADATRCTVRLVRGVSLQIEVADDGRGMGQHGHDRSGVGILSMGERVAELGGTLRVESVEPGGTTITAVLPLRAAGG
jgi:two-component system NarL family sensor kinase